MNLEEVQVCPIEFWWVPTATGQSCQTTLVHHSPVLFWTSDFLFPLQTPGLLWSQLMILARILGQKGGNQKRTARQLCSKGPETPLSWAPRAEILTVDPGEILTWSQCFSMLEWGWAVSPVLRTQLTTAMRSTGLGPPFPWSLSLE